MPAKGKTQWAQLKVGLLAIAALTIFVLLEKVAPLGVQGGRLSGVLLFGYGAWELVGAFR